MSKLLQETNGVVFSTVSAIAEYCEVSEKAVQNLIVNNKDTFLKLSNRISSSIGNTTLTVPEFSFVMSKSGQTIDWDCTKLYDQHIQFLLTLMKNSKIVTKHKSDIIVELFTLRVKSVIDSYEKKQLLHDNNMLKLEQEKTLLQEKLEIKPSVKYVNSDVSSRLARHKELQEWVSQGLVESVEQKRVRYIYNVTKEGKRLGLKKQNGVITFR